MPEDHPTEPCCACVCHTWVKPEDLAAFVRAFHAKEGRAPYRRELKEWFAPSDMPAITGAARAAKQQGLIVRKKSRGVRRYFPATT